jgi:hypothetical protein
MGKNKGAARMSRAAHLVEEPSCRWTPGLERVTPQAVAAQAVTAQAVTAGHSELPITTACEVPRRRELPASAALGARRTTVVAAAAATAEMPATRRRVVVLRMRCSLQSVPAPMILRRFTGA